jgi:hypothetical protein
MRMTSASGVLLTTCLVAVALCSGCGTPRQVTQVQRLAGPPPGKALVNFHRPSNAAGGVTYPIFHGSGKMLCELPRRGLFQYICDPGEQIFISWAEQVSVVKADLAPDKIYDIMADLRLGWVRNNFALVPLAKGDARRAKLAEFERREKMTVGLDRTEYVTKYEADHQTKVEQIKWDFFQGEKTNRVRHITKEDCR